MVNEFTSEPKRDPAAEILGQSRHEVSREDRERFMSTVWLAMDVLNRHPKTTESMSVSDKPIKELSETIELPGGEADIEIRFGGTLINHQGEHPTAEISLYRKFSTFSPTSNAELARITKVEFWGSGELFVHYADAPEDFDQGEDSWFKVHVDEINHENYPDYHSDWDHLEEIELAMQVLNDQTPPR